MRLFCRIWIRAILLIAWTLGMWSIRVTAGAVLVPLNRKADVAVRGKLLYIWAKGITTILRMRVAISGTPPKPPYLLVTNHLSYLDIVLLSLTVGCVFVSRADVQQMPLVGFIAKTMNTLFINRENARDTKRVNALIQRQLDRGYGVHFFAEGAISQDATVHPFKPSLLQPAASKEQPVYFAALSYKAVDWPIPASESIVWRDPDSLGQNMYKVLHIPRIEATIRFGDEPIAHPDRKVLADQLYRAVQQRFEPMV